jgi:hypothetical protein
MDGIKGLSSKVIAKAIFLVAIHSAFAAGVN